MEQHLKQKAWLRITLFVAFYFIGLILTGILLTPFVSQSTDLTRRIIIMAGILAMTTALVSYFLHQFEGKNLEQAGFVLHLPKFAAGLLLGALLQVAGWGSMYALGVLRFELGHPRPAALVGELIFLALVAFHEEILSRGYLQSTLVASLGPWRALLIASLLFGAMHLGNPGVAPLPIANIVLAGLLIGLSYRFDGNLSLPIGMHWSWNFVQGPILGYSISGTQGGQSLLTLHIQGPAILTGGDFGFEGSILCTGYMLVLAAIIWAAYTFPKKQEF